MKTEIEQKLQDLLDARDRSKEKAVSQATQRENVEAKNLADFYQKKDSVIRPALQEIADIYQKRGAFIRIEETAEGENSRTGAKNPTIALDMAGPSFYDRAMKPAFRFYFYKDYRKLMLHTTSSWKSGPAGDIPLDEISADWIQEAFLKYESGV